MATKSKNTERMEEAIYAISVIWAILCGLGLVIGLLGAIPWPWSDASGFDGVWMLAWCLPSLFIGTCCIGLAVYLD